MIKDNHRVKVTFKVNANNKHAYGHLVGFQLKLPMQQVHFNALLDFIALSE